MSFRTLTLALLAVLLTALAAPVTAQDSPPAQQPVTITNPSDDLELVGLFYPAPEPESPAALLMHHGGARKEAWVDLIPPLQAAGYAVLTVDLRGHGETGGSFTADLAQEDAALWLAWLREQPDIDPGRVSIVGASLGADVGLQVMARDEQLATLVGLSVALEIEGMNSQDAVEQIGARPLFLAAALGVEDEAQAVRTLFGIAEGEIQARLYDNTACCTFLMLFDRNLAPDIINWLQAHD